MPYFNVDIPCRHYPAEWRALLNYIHNEWEETRRNSLPNLTYPIEAKALSVLTMARRMARSASRLAEINNNNWKTIFVEASIVLFPMLELIGHSRLGINNMFANRNGRRRSSDNLISGIEWLIDQDRLPAMKTGNYNPNTDIRRVQPLATHMRDHPDGPQVSELYQIRNYFIHGVKEFDDARVSMPDVLNYEIPEAIKMQSEIGMRRYWEQLKQDDGSQEWVIRLSDADIRPLIIQGSGLFDAGLLDPDITQFLEGSGPL